MKNSGSTQGYGGLLKARETLLEADFRLGEALQRVRDGTGTIEECLLAFLVMSRMFDEYMNQVRVILLPMRTEGPDRDHDSQSFH